MGRPLLLSVWRRLFPDRAKEEVRRCRPPTRWVERGLCNLKEKGPFLRLSQFSLVPSAHLPHSLASPRLDAVKKSRLAVREEKKESNSDQLGGDL